MYTLILSLFLSSNRIFAEVETNSDKLKNSLYKTLTSAHKHLTYAQANDILFTKLPQAGGEVCSVYTSDKCASSNEIPNPKIMNIEHTRPQSSGAMELQKVIYITFFL